MDENKIKGTLFGLTFLLSQKWQTMGDRFLAPSQITTKQWLLLAAMDTLGEKPATLKDITEVFGTSRQNVKQIALGLEKHGFIKISRDVSDKRVLRFEITDTCRQFWSERTETDRNYVEDLFTGLTSEELEITLRSMTTLFENTRSHS